MLEGLSKVVITVDFFGGEATKNFIGQSDLVSRGSGLYLEIPGSHSRRSFVNIHNPEFAIYHDAIQDCRSTVTPRRMRPDEADNCV